MKLPKLLLSICLLSSAFAQTNTDIPSPLTPGTNQTTGTESLRQSRDWYSLGTDAYKRGDLDEAEQYFRQALKIRQDLVPDSLLVAASLSDLGLVAWRRGDVKEAEEYYRQSLAIREKMAPDSLLVARSLSRLGLVAANQGDLTKAEDYHRQALEIRQKRTSGGLPVAASFYNLGIVAWTRGDLDKAEEYHRQALEIRQKLAPESLLVAASINNLGWVAWRRGDGAKAKEYYSQALEIREKLAPESLDVAASFNSLGDLASNQGNLAAAEEYHRKALQIRQRLAPDSLLVAASMNNLGLLAWRRGDLANAEKWYRQALEIRSRRVPGSHLVAASCHNLGMVAWRRGDRTQAEAYFHQTLEINEKLPPGRFDVANGINNLGGKVATIQGDLEEAEEHYSEALMGMERLSPDGLTTADVLQSLGDLAYERRDPAKAKEYYLRALAGFETLAPGSTHHAETLAALASIARGQHEPEAAAHLYEEALGALETQITHLGGSDDLGWDFRAKHLFYYQDYIDLLVHQKEPEKAFSVVERSRARSLLELLSNAQINIHGGVAPSLLLQERSLQAGIAAESNRRVRLLGNGSNRSQVADIEKEIAGLLAQYHELEGRIRSSSPSYTALTQPRVLSLAEVQQQLLDHDTLLLEYSLGKESSYVFAVAENSFSVFELPKGEEIEGLARSLYDALTERNRTVAGETDAHAQERWKSADGKYTQLAARLSQMILGPVASLIDHKRLVIASDGALQFIPFAALPEPGNSPTTSLKSGESGIAGTSVPRPMGKSGIPLMVGHEIVNLPSASVVAELRHEKANRTEPPQAVAVLADPVFDPHDRRVAGRERGVHPLQVAGRSSPDSASPLESLTRSASEIGFTRNGKLDLGRLEYTRQEANSILKFTPRGASLEAVDFQATRKMAMSPVMAQYRVVHFATHGILNSLHPELSGLVFSLVDQHGKPQDGFLDLQDIYDLNLPVDLVVLSGCKTGLGKEIEGEGLIGLTRGFMYAGSSRVMASLWSVSDEATAELMEAFYKAMERDKKSPAAALRAAQIAIWKQDLWRSPYYWAAFQLQGEWK